jgi:hypothetical protein
VSGAVQFPAATAPTPDIYLEAFRLDLVEWAGELGARVSVARDPFNVLELLYAATAPLVIIHMPGEENVRPDGPADPMTRQRVELTLSAPLRKLAAHPEAAISQAVSPAKPLLVHLSDLRKRVLAWRMDATIVHHGRLFYSGFDQVTAPDDTPLAAWTLRYYFRAPIPAPAAADLITLTLTQEEPAP